MNKKNRVGEYLVITLAAQAFWLCVLSPYIYYIVTNQNLHLYLTWLWTGSIVELCVAYWFAKYMVRMEPRIRKKFGNWNPCEVCGRG